METGLDEYRTQIENWMESICEITFGNTLTNPGNISDKTDTTKKV